MEKQALRSSICFSSTVNEQTVCVSRQEVRSTGLRVFHNGKQARQRVCTSRQEVRSTGLRVFLKGKQRCEAAFVFNINMDGWKL